MSKNSIVKITENDLIWGFDNSVAVTGPKYYVKRGSSHNPIYVDPHPGYCHVASLVYQELDYVTEKFPVPVPITVYLPIYDSISRTNGVCMNAMGWAKNSSQDRIWTGSTIVLHGKRIPIHPAMTRYLVAHEYGHAVQRLMEINEGIIDEPSYGNPFIDKYAELRGIDKSVNSEGKWHLQPQEVFANDFRILICRREADFWPHISIPRPTLLPKLIDWWMEKLENVITKLRESQKVENKDEAACQHSSPVQV